MASQQLSDSPLDAFIREQRDKLARERASLSVGALSQPSVAFRDGPLQPAPPGQVDGSPMAPAAPPVSVASNQERLRELERLVRDEWVAGGGGSLERIRNDGTGAPDPDKGLLDKLGEGHYREQDVKRMLAEERQREYNELVLDKNRRSRRDGGAGQPVDLTLGLRDRSNERAQAAAQRNKEYNDFVRANDRRLQQLQQQQQQLPQQRGAGRPPLPPEAPPLQVVALAPAPSRAAPVPQLAPQTALALAAAQQPFAGSNAPGVYPLSEIAAQREAIAELERRVQELRAASSERYDNALASYPLAAVPAAAPSAPLPFSQPQLLPQAQLPPQALPQAVSAPFPPPPPPVAVAEVPLWLASPPLPDRDEKRRQAALQRNLEYNQHLSDRESAEKERALYRRGIGAMPPEAPLPAVPPFSPPGMGRLPGWASPVPPPMAMPPPFVPPQLPYEPYPQLLDRKRAEELRYRAVNDPTGLYPLARTRSLQNLVAFEDDHYRAIEQELDSKKHALLSGVGVPGLALAGTRSPIPTGGGFDASPPPVPLRAAPPPADSPILGIPGLAGAYGPDRRARTENYRQELQQQIAMQDEIKRRAKASELAVDASGFVNITSGEPGALGGQASRGGEFLIGGGGGQRPQRPTGMLFGAAPSSDARLAQRTSLGPPPNPYESKLSALTGALLNSNDAYNFYAQRDPLVDPLPPTVPVEQSIAPVVAEILAGTPLSSTLGRQYGPVTGGGGGGGSGRYAIPETTAQASYKSPVAQNRGEQLNSNIFGGDDDRKQFNRSKGQAYAQELAAQVAEANRKKLEEKAEKERYDRQKEQEMFSYQPFGRAGGGAPLKDQAGNVYTDLRQLRAGNQDNLNNPGQAANPFYKPTSMEPSAGGVSGSPRSPGDPAARGGHGIFGTPLTDEQKAASDRYKLELAKQMEDKRLREEEMKRKAAEEDAKEDRRIAEQQARIAREYEDEIKQRKEKEEERQRQQEESKKLLEEKQNEAAQKGRKGGRKGAGGDTQRGSRARAGAESRQSVQLRGPPFGASNPHDDEVIPTMKSKKKGGGTARASREGRPRESEDDWDRRGENERDRLDRREREHQAELSRERERRRELELELQRERERQRLRSPGVGGSPPIPTVRRKLRDGDVLRDVSPPPPSSSVSRPSTAQATVLRQLAQMKTQLNAEKMRVEAQLAGRQVEPTVNDPRLDPRTLARPQMTPVPVDMLEAVTNRHPVVVRHLPPPGPVVVAGGAPPPFVPASIAGDFAEHQPRDPDWKAVEEFKRLKRQDPAFARMYPNYPDSHSTLQAQQRAYLQFQRDRIEQLKTNPPDVDTYAARLPGQRTGGFGTNDEILDRLIEADHSRPPRVGSASSIDPEKLAEKNAERLRKLRELSRDANDMINGSLDDHERVLSNFMTQRALSGNPKNRPGSRYRTPHDETWLEPASKL